MTAVDDSVGYSSMRWTTRIERTEFQDLSTTMANEYNHYQLADGNEALPTTSSRASVVENISE